MKKHIQCFNFVSGSLMKTVVFVTQSLAGAQRGSWLERFYKAEQVGEGSVPGLARPGGT